jgi:uncharacterized membrane protein
VLILGTAPMVFAAATGFRDRARRTTPGSQTQRLANVHAPAMAVVGLVAVVDIVLRSYVYPSATEASPAVLLTTAPLGALTAVGSRLGGALVFRLGVGTVVGSGTAPGSRPT